MGDDQSSTDGLFSDSDFEENAAPDQLSNKFYWYGKTIFTLFIAEMVLEESPDPITADELDVGTLQCLPCEAPQ